MPVPRDQEGDIDPRLSACALREAAAVAEELADGRLVRVEPMVFTS